MIRVVHEAGTTDMDLPRLRRGHPLIHDLGCRWLTQSKHDLGDESTNDVADAHECIGVCDRAFASAATRTRFDQNRPAESMRKALDSLGSATSPPCDDHTPTTAQHGCDACDVIGWKCATTAHLLTCRFGSIQVANERSDRRSDKGFPERKVQMYGTGMSPN